MEQIIDILKKRKQWAENGLLIYGKNDQSRREYEARIGEIDNAIYIVEQFLNPDIKPFYQDSAGTFQMPDHTGNIKTGNPGYIRPQKTTGDEL